MYRLEWMLTFLAQWLLVKRGGKGRRKLQPSGRAGGAVPVLTHHRLRVWTSTLHFFPFVYGTDYALETRETET